MLNGPRMLGLDVGDKRIGVAVSDATGMFINPVGTVQRKNLKLDVARIKELAKQHGAEAFVIGLPKNMDGTEGNQAAKVRSFARELIGETSLPIHFEDERLSTFTAIERLVERGIKTGQNRDLVDMEAAAVILESFLQRQSG
jgi:putative Holliday junction resolvase